MLYFQSIALTRIRIRYVHRRRTILHSTILIYALKEVIYVLTLKVTQLWNVSFPSDSVKSGRSDTIFDEYLGRRWFEVYQCGTPYCAINNYKKKKKRTRKRQTKNHSILDRPVKSFVKMYGKIYTYLTELCIYVYVFIIINAKWIPDHGVWFPCMI